MSAQAAPAEAPKTAKKRKLLFVVLAAVLVVGGAGAAWFFTAGAKAGKPAAEAKKSEQGA